MSNQTRAKDVQGTPKNGGQFATPLHSEPTETLTPAPSNEADFPPIMVTVTLEQRQNDSAAPLFHDIEFDATKILNTYTKQELDDLEDNSQEVDGIYLEAVNQGLVADHDGVFEIHVRDAIDKALEENPERFDARNRQIELAAGEQEDYDELADGEVIEQIAVSRSEDGETATIDATKRLNLVDLAPSELSYNEKQEWLAFNGPTTAAFFRERYGADLTDGEEGFEEIYATTSAVVPFEGLTPVGIAGAAWGSGIFFIHNEYDNGTFGSENMDRLLQEACSEPPVIPIPSGGTVFIRSDRDGTERLSAEKLSQPTHVPGFSREYNRYTGEFIVKTPHGDQWTYSVAK